MDWRPEFMFEKENLFAHETIDLVLITQRDIFGRCRHKFTWVGLSCVWVCVHNVDGERSGGHKYLIFYLLSSFPSLHSLTHKLFLLINIFRSKHMRPARVRIDVFISLGFSVGWADVDHFVSSICDGFVMAWSHRQALALFFVENFRKSRSALFGR